MSITIRPEQVADEQSIGLLIEEAFRSHPHSQQTEHWIVAHLRRSRALTLSLVAVESTAEGETVVGHIAFSPVTTSAGLSDWYGLGPLAVKVTKQRQGIGKMLVEAGLEQLRSLGALGCVVVGDPAYYTRFGFRHQGDCVVEGIPPEYVMALTFPGPHQPPQSPGMVAFHRSFYVTSGDCP